MASRIKGITVEIGGDTTGLDKALKSVNSSITHTQSALKDVNKLLKLDPSNTELLTQKQKLLKDAVSSTKEKLDALKQAQEQAKQQLESGNLGQDKYDALQREVVETEQELKRLQEQAIESNAALAKIEEVGGKLESVGNSISGAGKKLLPVTTGVVALGTAAVKTAADFDTAMSQVAAVSGATGDDLQALRDKAREMGEKTKFSASEAAEAMNYMAMAGWKSKDMISGIDGIMSLAAASGEDLATTSGIVTDALTAFGLSAKDSGHFADILAAASSSANTNVSMMGETFKYCAPIAGALGFSAEDTAEAIGLMANAGIKSSQAGTALRTIMNNLASEVKISGAAIGDVTIATTNADGSMRDLSDILADCRGAFGKLTESEKAQAAESLVGKNAMYGFLALMNAAPADIEKLSGAIDNCDGTAEKMAATMQDNFAGQLTILKSQLQELAISFGEVLMPAIRSIVSKVQAFVDKLNGMSDAQREAIIKILAVAAALGPLLIVLGKTISTVGTTMKSFSTLTKGVAKLGVKIAGSSGSITSLGSALGAVAGPVLAVVAVIATLVAAFKHLWDTNEEFRNVITAIWDGIKAKFEAFSQGIVDRLNALGFDFENIVEVLKTIWDGFCSLLAPVFEGAFQAISAVLSTVLDVITGILDVFIGLFTGNWSQMWSGIKEIFSGVWEGIKGVLSAAIGIIRGIVDVFLGWFGTSWSEVWSSVKSFFEGIWNGITSFLSGVWETIKNVVQTGIMLIGSILSAAFDIITLPFQFIWENCKEIIISAWNAIKNTVSTVLSAIYSVIASIMGVIQNVISTIWTAISTKVSTVVNAIKTVVTTIFNAIKSVATTVWNGIKSVISTVVDGIKSKVSSVFNSVKSTVSSVFNGIKSTATSVWNGIKSAIDQTNLALDASGLTVSWKRKDGTGAETALTAGETVSGGILTVNANKLAASSSGMITYFCYISYYDTETKNTVNISADITYTLVRNAENARLAYVMADTYVFKYDTNSALVGASQATLTAQVQGVNISKWQYKNSSGNWTDYPTTSDNSSITGGTLVIKPAHSVFVSNVAQIKLVTDDPDVYDTISITKMYDGSQGKHGSAGKGGLSVILGNEAQAIACTSGGLVAAAMEITIPFTGYVGITQTACTCTVGTLPSGVTVKSNTAATTSAAGSVVLAVAVNATLGGASVLNGTIDLTFTVSGATVKKQFSWSKSNKGSNGASGANAIVFSVYAPQGTVVMNQSGSLSLAAAGYDGASEITTGATYQWARYTGGQWVNISGATSSTLAVSGSDIVNIQSYRCTMTYKGKSYVDVITVEDKSDPYVSEMLSIGGFTVKNNLGGVVPYVIVRTNQKEVDALLGNISETAPSNPKSGDLWYQIDHTAKTVTLMKYSGTAWAAATEKQELTYTWYAQDKDGQTVTFTKTGKVIYLSAADIDSILTLQCDVSN